MINHHLIPGITNVMAQSTWLEKEGTMASRDFRVGEWKEAEGKGRENRWEGVRVLIFWIPLFHILFPKCKLSPLERNSPAGWWKELFALAWIFYFAFKRDECWCMHFHFISPTHTFLWPAISQMVFLSFLLLSRVACWKEPWLFR